MTTTLDIQIQGRDYRVACPPEQVDSLQAAAALLNRRLGEIAQATRSTGERLAIMTALNLAHDLDAVPPTALPPAQQVPPPDPSKNSIAQSLDAPATLVRIKAIEARLDAALALQENPL